MVDRRDPGDRSHAESELRRSILDSARTVVVEQGYAALTMRRLARKIGYSATSIYLHFESKDALLHALIEEGMDALHDHLVRAAAMAPSPAEAVRNVCEAYIRFGLDNPEYYEIMFMLHPDRMERFPAAKYRRARRNLAVIADAIQAARPSDWNPDETTLLEVSAVWGHLHGAVSLMIAQRIDAGIDRQAFVQTTIDRVMIGLGFEFEEANR